MLKKILLLAVLLSILAGSAGYAYFYYKCKLAEPEWFQKAADRGDLRKLVSATGSLAAINTVEVGTQISGILASIVAGEGTEVPVYNVIGTIDEA